MPTSGTLPRWSHLDQVRIDCCSADKTALAGSLVSPNRIINVRRGSDMQDTELSKAQAATPILPRHVSPVIMGGSGARTKSGDCDDCNLDLIVLGNASPMAPKLCGGNAILYLII